jgi:short-subunit dehydrogenase
MSKLSRFAASRVWVVTGAASGIGREMTRELLRCQAIVWALDFDQSGLAELSQEAARLGQDLFVRTVDVCDRVAMGTVMDEIIAVSKKIHVWINNAGIQKIGPFSEQSPELFDKIMAVNFSAVVHGTRDVLGRMNEQGEGVILNMASVAAHVPAPFMAAYVASKHAVLGFSRSLRAELQLLKSPIRCAVASPGFVNTQIIDRGHDAGFPEWLSWMLANPRDCAVEILGALASGRDEIAPTFNGRAMTAAFRFMPDLTVQSSRVLLTRGLKDFLLNRYHTPQG